MKHYVTGREAKKFKCILMRCKTVEIDMRYSNCSVVEFVPETLLALHLPRNLLEL